MQMCKMDVYIPYWDSCNKQVKVHHLGREFLGHVTSKGLAIISNKFIETLNQSCILQIAMDEPNVN